MSTPLLTTKLFVPLPRANLVQRPRLTAQLTDGLTRPLTLLSAPAGFGKTTLVSEALAQAAGPHAATAAWLSLDADDNDPTRFWTYVIAALQALQPGLGETALALLNAAQPQPAQPKAILTTLLNDLAAQPNGDPAGRPRLLILDDYHVIDAGPIHEALAFLVDYLPPGLRLVITSRADPPLPLARWRARGLLAEIRADDLRFTPAEASAFFAQATGFAPSPDEIAALEARTEGWIAGLQLAALSLKGRADRAAFIAAFAGSHRYVVDYLAEEVLGRLPEATQDFLLQTSILERMSGELCDAVTGGTDGRAALEALERENLFVISLDEERRWYRYHHLFADALRSRLRALHPGRPPELHRRAGAWFEQNGFVEEAVAHALASGDHAHAAQLVERNAGGLLDHGQHATLQGWLDALPGEVVRARPRLGLIRATTLFETYKTEAAELSLREVEAALGGPAGAGEADADLPGAVAVIRAGIALYHDDHERTIELARQALAVIPADRLRLRAQATRYLADGHMWGGFLVEASPHLLETARLAEAAGDLYTSLYARSAYASNLWHLGRLREEAAVFRDTLRRAAASGQAHMPILGLAHAELADVLIEWNELAEAAEHVEAGMRLGESGALPHVVQFCLDHRARLALIRGDYAGASAILRQARDLAEEERLSQYYLDWTNIWQVRAWLAQGDLAQAAAWADTVKPEVQGEHEFVRYFGYIGLAQIWAALGKPAQALELLGRMRAVANAKEWQRSVMEFLVVEAAIHYRQGDLAQALEAVEAALRLGEPEGYIRIFLDADPNMGEVLAQWRAAQARRGPGPAAYADQILAAYAAQSAAPAGPPATPPTAPPQPLPEALSAREIEVVRLMADGLSNAEIAQTLVIGAGTVKTHVNNIFRKLDAKSRTQAVARARALGLLTG